MTYTQLRHQLEHQLKHTQDTVTREHIQQRLHWIQQEGLWNSTQQYRPTCTGGPAVTPQTKGPAVARHTKRRRRT